MKLSKYALWFCIAVLALAQPASAATKRVLMVVTSNGELYGTGKKTGFWFDELATPYYLFKSAGYSVTIASINGGTPPIEPLSEFKPPAAVKRFEADKDAMQALSQTRPLSEAKEESYDGIWLCGGNGGIWDFSANADLTHLLEAFVKSKKPIAAIAQGTVALFDVKTPDGKLLVAGRNLSAFTKEEDKAMNLDSVLPFYADLSLQNIGAHIIRAKPFQPQAVRDGLLITGQNPASTEQAAKLMLQALLRK